MIGDKIKCFVYKLHKIKFSNKKLICKKFIEPKIVLLYSNLYNIMIKTLAEYFTFF